MLELEKLLPKKASVRQLRVAELIKETLAKALQMQEVDNKVINENFITISHVDVSPDLYNVRIYFTAYNCGDNKILEKELNICAPKFRYIIANQVRLRSSPKITFKYDDQLDRVARIDELLE